MAATIIVHHTSTWTRTMISVRRFLSVPALLAIASAGYAEQWLHYGGDAGGQKYSPLTQINAANVPQLEVAWQYSTGELARRPELQARQWRAGLCDGAPGL